MRLAETQRSASKDMGTSQGKIVVDTGCSGCFSAERLSSTITLDQKAAYLEAYFSLGVGGELEQIGQLSLSISDAKRFINIIQSVYERKQTPYEIRNTTYYHADVEWDFGDLQVKKHTKTCEMEAEHMREFIRSDQNSESALKIKSLLEQGYYNWTHEIYRLSVAFLVQNFPEKTNLWQYFPKSGDYAEHQIN